MATNQGPSSNQTSCTKTPYQMPAVGNKEGAESGVSDTAGLGASPIPVNLDAAFGLNGDYSTENRAAKFKNPSVSQDQGAGANQYE